jgi:hypothetical protein
MLGDLTHPTGLASSGIFTPNPARSAVLREQAAFQSIGGQRGSRMLVSFCVAHVADATIEAHECTSNL